MGNVALCLIDEFYFLGKNDSINLNNTNANITLDDAQKDNIKEIKLKAQKFPLLLIVFGYGGFCI